MTPEQLAQDPAVRAAVFASVTVEEAGRILHSRAGKPWCDAFMLRLCGELADRLDGPDPADKREAAKMRSAGRAVTGTTCERPPRRASQSGAPERERA